MALFPLKTIVPVGITFVAVFFLLFIFNPHTSLTFAADTAVTSASGDTKPVLDFITHKSISSFLEAVVGGILKVFVPFIALGIIWIGFKMATNRDVAKITEYSRLFVIVLFGGIIVFSAVPIYDFVKKTADAIIEPNTKSKR
ncbi:MAG: hypothetical protein QM526_02530 [Alphaproteobacteria bacterium]|nr:hypothetical protein [Alphaproteobacteria bacterium]